MTALNELCFDGKLDEVRLALIHGVDVNDKDSIGQTSLMIAAVRGNN